MKNILNGSISEVNVEMQNNPKFSVPSGRAWRQPLVSEHLPSQTQMKLIPVYVRNSPQLVFFSAESSSLPVFPLCQAPAGAPGLQGAGRGGRLSRGSTGVTLPCRSLWHQHSLAALAPAEKGKLEIVICVL